jgi:conjugal transfer pilus assembly protein TraW
VKFFTGLVAVMVLSGTTYEIAEPDLLEEIREREEEAVRRIEEKVREIRSRLRNFRGEELTPAKRNRTYYVDPTYCLEENIYRKEGEEWKVLYPAGYCFNPVEYITHLPPPMVVFNPCREEEVLWVKEYLKENPFVLLVASGCPLEKVSSQDWDLPVYYLLKNLKEKLSLSETISVISLDPEKKKIRVEVIDASGGSGRKASAQD